MPITPDRAIRSSARYQRPRWLLDLVVPIEAAQSAALGGSASGSSNLLAGLPQLPAAQDNSTVKFTVPISKFTLVRNDHNEADTLDVTTNWHYAGVDPRLIQSAIGTLHVGQATPGTNVWTPSEDDVRFIGIMMKPKRAGTDKGMEVEMLFHDYTALFLGCHHYNQKLLIPEYTDTVSSAWARICNNVGIIDPSNPETILPTVKALASRLVFKGGATDRVIGSAVPSRFQNLGKVQHADRADAWAIWQMTCGMVGLISFMRGDQCIVTTATDYYTGPNPPVFIWGSNIKTFDDERDAKITGKGVVITSFNGLTGTTQEGFWPPIGADAVRRHKLSAKKFSNENAVLLGEEREAFALPFAGTQDACDAYAKRVYEEYSRQEYQGKLTTSDMLVPLSQPAGDETNFDMLQLYDGDTIQVEVERDSLAALGQFQGEDDKIGYLVTMRGYNENVAKLVVRNLTGVLALPAVFLTKRVQIEGETTAEGGRFEFEISFCNRILVDGGAVGPSDTSDQPPTPPIPHSLG